MTTTLARAIGAILVTASLGAVAADKLSSHDQTFVNKAAASGMKEVEVSKLAQDHAASADVKSFAERMVTDHSKANDKLMGIVKDNGWMAPSALDKEGQAAVKDLSGKNGAEFDKAYMKAMVQDHADAVKLFRGEADKGDNAALKDFATNTVGTLEQHDSMARELKKKVG
jgi:putative membrane protein